MNPEEDEGGEAQVLSAESMLSPEPFIPPLKIRIPLTMLKIRSSFRVFIVVPHPLLLGWTGWGWSLEGLWTSNRWKPWEQEYLA